MNVNSIKKVLKLYLPSSLRTTTLFLTIAFFIGFAIVLGVMLILKPDTYICLGGLLATISGGAAIVVVSATAFSVQFAHTVKMNISRRTAFVGLSVSSIASAGLATILLVAFFFIESATLRLFFGSSVDMEILTGDLTRFTLMMSGIFVGLMLLSLLLCAVLAKYNRSGVLVLYFIFLAGIMTFSKISLASFRLRLSLPPFVLPLCAVLAAIAALAWSAHALLTIEL